MQVPGRVLATSGASLDAHGEMPMPTPKKRRKSEWSTSFLQMPAAALAAVRALDSAANPKKAQAHLSG